MIRFLLALALLVASTFIDTRWLAMIVVCATFCLLYDWRRS